MFKIQANGKTIYASKFSTVDAAYSYINRSEGKPVWVCAKDGVVVVVRPVDAGRLEKLGWKLV